MVSQKSMREIEILREAGRIAGQTLELVGSLLRPGLPTLILDQEAEKFIRSQNATPEFKGYRGFPACICISINEEVVHGIPSSRQLREGDIVSVDVGVRYQGYIGDCAKTFPVGKISKAAARLLTVCQEALQLGIEQAKPGNKISHIARAIQHHAESNGYNVVRDYTGHGIGQELHEDPQIPNYVDNSWITNDIILKPGYCIAIEPMINIGTFQIKTARRQGWDVVLTKDHKWSAHFEHSVAVLEQGPKILTLPDSN